MRIVLDTNILLVSFSRKSKSYWIVEAFRAGRFELAFTNEILVVYEEEFDEHWNAIVAEDVVTSILELPNAIQTTVYYSLQLINQDPDDNKFADCAFAANADYLVTDDGHFNILKRINFPAIRVVSLPEFKQILLDANLLEP